VGANSAGKQPSVRSHSHPQHPPPPTRSGQRHRPLSHTVQRATMQFPSSCPVGAAVAIINIPVILWNDNYIRILFGGDAVIAVHNENTIIINNYGVVGGGGGGVGEGQLKKKPGGGGGGGFLGGGGGAPGGGDGAGTAPPPPPPPGGGGAGGGWVYYYLLNL